MLNGVCLHLLQHLNCRIGLAVVVIEVLDQLVTVVEILLVAE